MRPEVDGFWVFNFVYFVYFVVKDFGFYQCLYAVINSFTNRRANTPSTWRR